MRGGYVPSWKCQVGRLFPPLMVASAVHAAIDVASWLGALTVMPNIAVPFAGGAWTPESLFWLVAVIVTVVAGQLRVSAAGEPDFFGVPRWAVATLLGVAASFALPVQQVNWGLLGATSALVLLLRTMAAEGVLTLRRALHLRAPAAKQATSLPLGATARTRVPSLTPRRHALLPALLVQRSVGRVGRPIPHLARGARH